MNKSNLLPLPLVCAVWLLAGCARSTYVPPAVQVPTTWSQTAQTTADGAADHASAFWKHFNDPVLDSLIADALRTNNDLAVAAIRVRRAQLQAGIAATNLLPGVQAQANAGRNFDLKAGSGAPGTTNTSSTNLTLSYELDMWGRLAAVRSTADWEARATEADRQGAALTLVGTTARLYWQTGVLNQRIVLGEAAIADGQRLLAFVRTRHAAGAVSALDVASAEQNLATVEAAQTQLLQQRTEARNALAILFDRPPEQAAAEPQSLPDGALPAIDAGLPASLLGRRPDLRAAEARLRGAFSNVDAVRTGFYPTLTLTGAWGSTSNALVDLLRNPIGTLGAGLTLPFLQWNTTRLTIRVSQTQYEEAVVTFRQSLYTALSEVENTLSSRTQLRAEHDKLQVSYAQALRAERLTDVRYRAGAIPVQPLLDAKDRRRTAESALAQNRFNQLNATMTLYRALGGDAVTPAASDSPTGAT